MTTFTDAGLTRRRDAEVIAGASARAASTQPQLALALGLATGCVAATLDVAITLLGGYRGDAIALAAYAITFSGGVGAAVGTLVGLWQRLSSSLLVALPNVNRWPIRGLLTGVPLALFACWVPSRWIAEHWEDLSQLKRGLGVLVYLILAVGSCVVTWGLRRVRSAALGKPRLKGIAVGAGLVLAGACYWGDRVVLVGLYEQFHYGLTGGFALGLAWSLCLLLERRPWLQAPVAKGWLVAVGLIGTSVGLELAQPNVYGTSDSLVFSKLLTSAGRHTDLDEDGASSWFGGGDCAPNDARIAPGKFDIPGNGIDENCDNVEARWPEPLPDPNYPIVERPGYNVLLITIDAVRADHVGAYGYTRRTTPNIDELAGRSLVFENAFSQASKTAMSIPSILSGIYPGNLPRDYDHPRVQRLFRGTFHVGEEVPMLAELLAKRGYGTQGYVYFSVTSGLFRGFEHMKRTNSVGRAASRPLQNLREPFFVWTHFGYPHDPYKRHKQFDFGSRPIDRYDSEIAKSDQEVGGMLSVLEKRGLLDRTIIVITSDHGEEFGEHGSKYHRPVLYHELLHVPLIVHVPGVEPKRIAETVELADIVPTLTETLDLAATPQEFDGQSLWATIAGKRGPGQKGAYAEVFEPYGDVVKRSLNAGGWRTNWSVEKARLDLFDKVRDPGEKANVAAEHPVVVREQQALLDARGWRRAAGAFRSYQRSRDPAELLRNMGAIQRPDLVDAALDRLSKHEHLPASAHRPLRAVLKRSMLTPDQRQRVLRLLERVRPMERLTRAP